MYINQVVLSPQFKAAQKTVHEFPTEAELFRTLRLGQTIPIESINPQSKETLFHYLVANNYEKLIELMVAANYDFSKVINQPNTKGSYPLDDAVSDKMKNLLKRLGGVSLKIQTAVPPLQKTEDARVVATKTYMTQPVMEKVEERAAKTEPKSFFNAFEQIEDTEDAAVEIVENKNNAKTDGIKPKALNIDGLKDFKLLEITDSDILSLNDLIGQTTVKNELESNVIVPLKDFGISNKLKENNVDLPNGILFSGQGGEMTVIKALSNEAEIPVIIMENPQELPQILVAVEARYKDTGLKTAILAQGFGKYFPEGNQNNVQANAFRNALKGIKNKGALFIATTPDKNLIGCDFMKSGIIDKVIDVVKPDKEDRTEFFRRHFEGKEIFKEISNEESISKIVELTDNCSYADMMRLLDEMVRKSMAKGKNVDIELFEEQLKCFSKELGIVPITEENKTASFDHNIRRIPVEEGEMMSLNELGGNFERNDELRRLYVNPLNNLEKLKDKPLKHKLPDGAIFYGDPGNGKSTVARVLARELKLPYYEIKLSNFGTSLVNEASKRFAAMVQDLVDKYKATGERSVLFLDEFDSIGAARGEDQAQHVKELTDTLLQVLDNPSKNGIILIAATNNLQDIDPALKRRGRLGNHIEFNNPTQEEREDTIRKILSKDEELKKYAEDNAWVKKIAKELDGFAMSSITFVLDDASRDYYLEDADFDSAITKAVDSEVKRLLSDLCGKTQLSQHVYSETAPKSLDELGGMSNIVQQLREHVITPWNPEIRQELIENNIEPSGGFILEGPPGGGKTTAIETLAREMNVPLFKMELDQEDNKWVGGIDKNIKEIFKQMSLIAKVRKAPVMLFFDEAERFFSRTSEAQLGSHEVSQTNKFKSEMNNAASMGIILAGATNHIELVNQEVIGNPRRMGTVIHCGEPNLQDRIDILGRLLSGHPRIKDGFKLDDIESIARMTEGFSIGELASSVKKLITNAIYKKENLTPAKIVQEFKMNIVPMHVR